MAPTSVATTGSSCDIASMITLGRPSRSPSPATRAARQKRSARRRAATTSSCVPAPRQAIRSAIPSRSARAFRPRRERAAADMLEAPVQVRRAAGPAPRSGRRGPSSRPRAPRRRCRPAAPRSLPSPPGARCGGGKPRRFQAVIDQLQIGLGRQRPQMVEVHPAAGHQPARASAIFSRFSQSGMVQTSLACAEMLKGRPRRIAA